MAVRMPISRYSSLEPGEVSIASHWRRVLKEAAGVDGERIYPVLGNRRPQNGRRSPKNGRDYGSVRLITTGLANNIRIGRVSLQLVDIRVFGTAHPNTIFVVQNGVRTNVRIGEHRRWSVAAADFGDQ